MHAKGTPLPGGQGASPHGSAGESRIAYTVAEVAKLLGKHPNTIYDWVGKGALPSQRIGNTIYIPKWTLGRLLTPDTDALLTVGTAPPGGDAA